MNLWELSCSTGALDRWLWLCLREYSWKVTVDLALKAEFPALRSYIYQDVGEPTCLSFQRLGCMQENHFIQWARRVTYYLRESLCRREEELSAPRISLFCFVSVSLLDVFLFGGGLCVCLFCFAFRRHAAFCISPVLLPSDNSWPFHLVSPFHRLVRNLMVVGLVLVLLLGVFVLCLLCVVGSRPFILIELSNNDYFSTASWLPQL